MGAANEGLGHPGDAEQSRKWVGRRGAGHSGICVSLLLGSSNGGLGMHPKSLGKPGIEGTGLIIGIVDTLSKLDRSGLGLSETAEQYSSAPGRSGLRLLEEPREELPGPGGEGPGESEKPIELLAGPGLEGLGVLARWLGRSLEPNRGGLGLSLALVGYSPVHFEAGLGCSAFINRGSIGSVVGSIVLAVAGTLA